MTAFDIASIDFPARSKFGLYVYDDEARLFLHTQKPEFSFARLSNEKCLAILGRMKDISGCMQDRDMVYLLLLSSFPGAAPYSPTNASGLTRIFNSVNYTEHKYHEEIVERYPLYEMYLRTFNIVRESTVSLISAMKAAYLDVVPKQGEHKIII